MGGIGAKRSKKSKSKRQTLKQKYKVLKKVKEHHRKKRRESKKLGLKPKEPKDPGIPSTWPFKEELIAQLKAQKERAVLKEKFLREQRKAQKVGDGRGRHARCGRRRCMHVVHVSACAAAAAAATAVAASAVGAAAPIAVS